MPNEQFMRSEAVAFALCALERSSQPLNVTKLANAIPKSAVKSKKDLREILQELVQSGQICRRQGRSSVYWLPSLEDQASAKILEALSEIPMTRTDLEKKLKSLLSGWPRPMRDEMLARLIRERRVYQSPPLTGKAKLLSVRPELTPQDYIKVALRLVAARLKPQGFTAEQAFAVAQDLLRREVNAHKPSVQLERMIQLKLAAANGALLSLSELRRSLAAEIPGGTAFDQAVLRLAESGRVALRHHDHPGALSQEEREAFVRDEQGNYYIGAVLRG